MDKCVISIATEPSTVCKFIEERLVESISIHCFESVICCVGRIFLFLSINLEQHIYNDNKAILEIILLSFTFRFIAKISTENWKKTEFQRISTNRSKTAEVKKVPYSHNNN